MKLYTGAKTKKYIKYERHPTCYSVNVSKLAWFSTMNSLETIKYYYGGVIKKKDVFIFFRKIYLILL